MRKISFILVLCMLISSISLFSCSQSPTHDDGRFVVVCSIFPQYDFCRQIMGDEGEVILLQKNGNDMHSYEPTSADILMLSTADMLVYTGGASDLWVDGALRSAKNTEIERVSLFDYATLLSADELGVEHDHDHGHDHADGEACDEYDEHVWTSPKNAIKIVLGLTDRLCEANPEAADTYRKKSEAYIQRLNVLDAQYSELSGSGKSIIVGDRFPFLYLCHDYGIGYHAAFAGCSSESNASFEIVLSLIDEARSSNAKCIFQTDNSGSAVAKRVAEECNVPVKNLNSCQSISTKELNSGESYISIMEKNLEILKEIE